MNINRRELLKIAAAVPLAVSAGVFGVATAHSEGKMYGLIGKIVAAKGKREELIGILLEGTRAMPGCLSYIVARDLKDADGIWVTEVWSDAESHRNSLSLPAVQSAIKKGKPLIASFESQTVIEPVGVYGLK